MQDGRQDNAEVRLQRSKSSRAARPTAKRSRARKAGAAATARDPARLALLPDDELLEIVQRQTFRYFWEAAHPVSGLAFDRRTSGRRADEADAVTIGGSGFGVMALIVAAQRGWVTRGAALERLDRMSWPSFSGNVMRSINLRSGLMG